MGKKTIKADEAKEPKTPLQEEKQKPEIKEEPKADEAKEKDLEGLNDAQKTKIRLSKQPKVRIIIPKEKTESKGATLPVTINGYRLNIPKGVYVEVPEQVAQIVMESEQQTAEALEKAVQRIPDNERIEFDNS